MAFTPTTGVLKQARPTAGVEVELYKADTDATASMSVACCNTGTSATTINIKIRTVVGGTTTDTLLRSGEPLAPTQRQGHAFDLRAVVLGPGQSLLVSSASGTVDFTALGYTGPANILAIS